jgi:hypothetical protein
MVQLQCFVLNSNFQSLYDSEYYMTVGATNMNACSVARRLPHTTGKWEYASHEEGKFVNYPGFH